MTRATFISAVAFIFAPLVAEAFLQPAGRPSHHNALLPNHHRPSTSSLFAVMDEAELKAELSNYLKKREELNADVAAKNEVGKVIGGTRGNAVLEFVSGAPNKERIQEDVPDIFDYDELSKYGFSRLATPIMKNGGRSGPRWPRGSRVLAMPKQRPATR